LVCIFSQTKTQRQNYPNVLFYVVRSICGFLDFRIFASVIDLLKSLSLNPIILRHGLPSIESEFLGKDSCKRQRVPCSLIWTHIA